MSGIKTLSMRRIGLRVTSAVLLVSLIAGGCGGSSNAPPRPEGKNPAVGSTSAIAHFGRSSHGEEREEIAAALLSYSAALARDDGPGACSQLEPAVRSELVGLAPRNGHVSATCGAAVRAMFSAQPQATISARRHIRIDDVRVSGDQAFVIYLEPGTDTQFAPMIRERGRWMMAAIGGTTLPR
jgi:hypothetical protein